VVVVVDSTRFYSIVLRIRGRRALRTWRLCAVLCDSWSLPYRDWHHMSVTSSYRSNLVAKALVLYGTGTTGILDIFLQAHREQKTRCAVLY